MMEMLYASVLVGAVCALGGFVVGGLVVRELYRGEGDRLRSDVLRHRLLLRGLLVDVRRAMLPGGDPAGLSWAAQAISNELVRGGTRWLHKRRGTTYEVLTHGAKLNVSDEVWLLDQGDMTVYVDVESGRVCVRASGEFLDGRFDRVDQD